MSEELKTFKKEYPKRIRNDAQLDNKSDINYFIEDIKDILIQQNYVEELDILELNEVIHHTKKYGKMHVDGGNVDFTAYTINLLHADYSEDGEGIISGENILGAVKQMENFVINSVKGYFDDKDKSAPETALGDNIKENYRSIHKIRMFYVSNKIISNRLNKMVEFESIKYLSHTIEIELVVIDVEKIFHYKSSCKREPIMIKTIDFGCEGIPCIEAEVKGEGYSAYLCVVQGQFLCDIYKKYDARLLEANVRSFLSVRASVNKGILNTIQYNPDKFFSYNNGICTTVKNVKIIQTENGPMMTEFDDLQIINGGQTTAMLAYASIKKSASLNRIYVQMKLTKIDDDKEAMVRDISTYANKQNKVNDSDLVSNHAFYVLIEGFANNIIPPAKSGELRGTQWFFERSRGAYDQKVMKMTDAESKRFKTKYPKCQKISKTDLAKYINAVKCEPYYVSRGSQLNMKQFQIHMVKQWVRDKSYFNGNYYKKLIGSGILFKETGKIISNEEWYKNHRAYRAELVAYTISKLIYECEKISGKAFDFRGVWDKQELSISVIVELKRISYKLFQLITDENRPITNIREYCKKETCWKAAIAIKHELSEGTISELIDVDTEKAQETYSKKDQRLSNDADKTIKIFNSGTKYWNNLVTKGNKEQLLNYKEINLLKKAANYCKTGMGMENKRAEEVWKIKERLDKTFN